MNTASSRWIGTTLLALICSSVGWADTPNTFNGDKRKVVVFGSNLQHFAQDQQGGRTRNFVRCLRDAQCFGSKRPDILLLQEVTRGQLRNFVAPWLSAELGGTYACMGTKLPSGSPTQGNGVCWRTKRFTFLNQVKPRTMKADAPKDPCKVQGAQSGYMLSVLLKDKVAGKRVIATSVHYGNLTDGHQNDECAIGSGSNAGDGECARLNAKNTQTTFAHVNAAMRIHVGDWNYKTRCAPADAYPDTDWLPAYKQSYSRGYVDSHSTFDGDSGKDNNQGRIDKVLAKVVNPTPFHMTLGTFKETTTNEPLHSLNLKTNFYTSGAQCGGSPCTSPFGRWSDHGTSQSGTVWY
jgi:hypothetical protein